MKLILAFVLALPSVYEAWTDRHGEGRRQKVIDALILIACASGLTILSYWLLAVPLLKTIVLLLAWRVLIFDYTVSYLLIKNDVIVGNWFTYTGKTSKFDKLIAGINPWLRLVVRVVLFTASIVWFIIPS